VVDPPIYERETHLEGGGNYRDSPGDIPSKWRESKDVVRKVLIKIFGFYVESFTGCSYYVFI